MPFVVNGCGTWYYGKDNLFIRRGTCRYCQRETELSSFDTTKYLVFAFIPLIPLGKSRVLDKCPRCTKHAVIPLKRWRQQRQEAIDKAIMAVNTHPDDPKAYQDALETFIAFQDRDLCLEYAAQARERYPDNAELLTQAGRMLTFFGRFEEAIETLTQALALGESDDLHELLAVTFIKAGRPDDASDHLLHIVENHIADKAGFIVLHAQGFQARGEHDKALEALDEAIRIKPGLAFDKHIKKLRKLSQKHLGAGKAIVSSNLSAVAQTRSRKGFRPRVAKIIGPLLLITILAIIFHAAWRERQHRVVYLVNGLENPYSVRMKGRVFNLSPHHPRKIEVAEGELQLDVIDREDIATPQTFIIKTPIFPPFIKYTFIINPDAAEVLVKENIHYAAVRPIKEEDSFTLLVGNTFYMVKDMDYVFAPYPEEISLSSNRDVVAKKRITTFSKTEFQLEYNDILYYLLDEKRLEDARRFLDTQVRYQPESDEWAYGFADLGYTHLCNAEFDLALDCYRQARSIDPNNPASETRFFDVLVATNALAEARDYCRQQFSETSLRMYWMTQDVLLTNRLDGEDAANILAVQYRKALDKAASPNQMEWIDDWERWLMIDLAYQRDNLDVYLSLLDKNNPKEVFQAAISTTILPSPASYETSENAFTYFLVYLAAVRSGAENPDDYFNKAVRLTADPNSENLQELLQTSPLNTSSICALELDPVEKTIMLTALGVKYPQHRDVFFSLARRLNHYSLEFPHLFLRSLHES